MRTLKSYTPFGFATIALFLLVAMNSCYAGQIHQAVKEKDAAKVQQLIQGKVDINGKDDQGLTALHYASWMGNEEIIRLLINAKANLNASVTDTKDTPLHFAVFNGHFNAVELLLVGGANANAQKADGWTPVHLAVAKGQKEILQLLLDKGADVNSVNKDIYGQCCVLLIAVWQEHADLLPILLKHGAKHPWLSRVKGFDPSTLSPIRLQRQSDGSITVGGLPFIAGSHSASRPWKKPAPSELSKTGKNYLYWASDKDNETGRDAVVIGIRDEKGQRTSLKLALPAYVGDDGVVYSATSTNVAQGGPFVTVVVRAMKEGGVAERARVELRRGDENIQLRADDTGLLTTTIGKVQQFEPLTVTFRGSKGNVIRVVEIDCVYAGSSKGLVSVEVPADK